MVYETVTLAEMNRILFDVEEIDAKGMTICRGTRADHLRDVLKVEPGQAVKIGVVDGSIGTGTVGSVDADGVTVHCVFDAHPPPPPRIDLLLALPRPKVLKRLWAPLASLGVGRIILTNAEKVERNYFDTHWLMPEFYRPLLVEGLQQAGDTHLPKVTICRRLRPFIADELPRMFPDGLRLVADPDGEQRIAAIDVQMGQRVLVAVGPEGGWIPFELDMFKAAGFRAVRLGSRILRTDIACIALLAMVQEQMDA